MTTKQRPIGLQEVQGAVYRVALSLDAFLLNGIPYGVLQQVPAEGFVQKTTGSLLGDLVSLEEQVAHAPVVGQPKTAELLASLRARCEQLVDLVSGLSSF